MRATPKSQLHRKGVQPGWDMPQAPATNNTMTREDLQPWAYGLGAQLMLPEMIPIDGIVFWRRWLALRAFYAPPLRFNVRVELPADQISSKGGLSVENPDATVNLKAVYGPHYGAEMMVFPFESAFFVSGGLSYRRFSLSGGGQTPLIVRSSVDPSASITTRTEFGVHASAYTEAWMTRASLGWLWRWPSWYIMLSAIGIAHPIRLARDVKVEGIVDAPGGSSEDVKGALALVKEDKEDEMEEKALKEMRPVEEKALPIIGLGVGFTF